MRACENRSVVEASIIMRTYAIARYVSQTTIDRRRFFQFYSVFFFSDSVPIRIDFKHILYFSIFFSKSIKIKR